MLTRSLTHASQHAMLFQTRDRIKYDTSKSFISSKAFERKPVARLFPVDASLDVGQTALTQKYSIRGEKSRPGPALLTPNGVTEPIAKALLDHT